MMKIQWLLDSAVHHPNIPPEGGHIDYQREGWPTSQPTSQGKEGSGSVYYDIFVIIIPECGDYKHH